MRMQGVGLVLGAEFHGRGFERCRWRERMSTPAAVPTQLKEELRDGSLAISGSEVRVVRPRYPYGPVLFLLAVTVGQG